MHVYTFLKKSGVQRSPLQINCQKKIQNPCPVDRLLLVWLYLGCLIYHILS